MIWDALYYLKVRYTLKLKQFLSRALRLEQARGPDTNPYST